jgi:DNA-binding MarR family transcriptional regulator
MIVRSARPHLNYSVVHNSLIEDEGLSWKARGILIYLLSKPDHWRTSTAHLASVSPEGIHAVRSGLQELERAGYVKRIRKQNPSGQWTMHTVVFDQPQPVDKGVDKS